MSFLVTTCDPTQLPKLTNGKHVQVKGLRAGMYRFSCNRGAHLALVDMSMPSSPFL